MLKEQCLFIWGKYWLSVRRIRKGCKGLFLSQSGALFAGDFQVNHKTPEAGQLVPVTQPPPPSPPKRGTEFYNRNSGAQSKNVGNLNTVTAYVTIFIVPINSNRDISLYFTVVCN